MALRERTGKLGQAVNRTRQRGTITGALRVRPGLELIGELAQPFRRSAVGARAHWALTLFLEFRSVTHGMMGPSVARWRQRLMCG